MIDTDHAIRILKAMRSEWDVNSKCPNADALDMAIKSLEKQNEDSGCPYWDEERQCCTE